MTFGDHYKCPRCDAIYSREEYDSLESMWVDPARPYEYGRTKICSKCGARLWIDRTVIKDYVKLDNEVTVEVSTADLVIEHEWNGDGGYFYETMLWFYRDKDSDVVLPDSEVVTRYKTREEAKRGHQRIVEALRKGKGYKFIKVPRLVVDFDKLENIAKGGKES